MYVLSATKCAGLWLVLNLHESFWIWSPKSDQCHIFSWKHLTRIVKNNHLIQSLLCCEFRGQILHIISGSTFSVFVVAQATFKDFNLILIFNCLTSNCSCKIREIVWVFSGLYFPSCSTFRNIVHLFCFISFLMNFILMFVFFLLLVSFHSVWYKAQSSTAGVGSDVLRSLLTVCWT